MELSRTPCYGSVTFLKVKLSNYCSSNINIDELAEPWERDVKFSVISDRLSVLMISTFGYMWGIIAISWSTLRLSRNSDHALISWSYCGVILSQDLRVMAASISKSLVLSTQFASQGWNSRSIAAPFLLALSCPVLWEGQELRGFIASDHSRK